MCIVLIVRYVCVCRLMNGHSAFIIPSGACMSLAFDEHTEMIWRTQRGVNAGDVYSLSVMNSTELFHVREIHNY